MKSTKICIAGILGLVFLMLSCGEDEAGSEKSDVVLSQKEYTASDTIPRIEMDGYPVSNQMLKSFLDKHKNGLKSGGAISHDQVWLRSKTTDEVLIFELYTDYHRMVTYHFYANDVEEAVIERIGLTTDDGKAASLEQKKKCFKGLLAQCELIDQKYFTSNQSILLGRFSDGLDDLYGRPEEHLMLSNSEFLKWYFIGDSAYDDKTKLEGRPLAKNSFGYSIEMYFSNGRLTARILENEIP